MNKREIIDMFENILNFRDYRFKSVKYWGKISTPNTMHLRNPDRQDLYSAVSRFSRDGFGNIVVYLSEKRMKPPKVKRIKRVFSSSYEVFHLWAAQTQSDARQGGSRTRSFFEGKSCYSYGRHYEVGRLVEINGVKCALINRDGYSSTTSKHINEASSAVSHLPQIDVDSFFNWKRGLVEMQNDLIDSLFNNLNRISFWKGSKAFDRYDRKRFEEFNTLCRKVGMPQLQLFPNAETIKVIDAYIKARLKRQAEIEAYKQTPEYLAKRSEDQRRKEEKLAMERAERQAREAIERAEREAKNAREIDDWKRGGPYTNALYGMHPQLIRVKGNKVETSDRASVPLSEACRALMLLENSQLKQHDKIGDYEFTKVENDMVKIGCHTISLEQAKSVLADAMKKTG